jgi:hypothetical protein
VIRGVVSVADNKDIAGYNVLLLNYPDSTFYKGDFFSDNTFEIDVEEIKLPLVMKISSFSCKDTLIYVDKNQLEFSDIVLKIESMDLPEIVVKQQIPIYATKKDRLTMNVRNTALNQAGTAVDVLQKAARVKVDNNGISVLGVGKAIIIVDGVTQNSNQILESISSSDIEKIDIITNPSAKYDAAGKAVIEITRKKVKSGDWGGELNARLGKGKDWRKYFGTEFSTQIANFSLFAFYSLSPSKRRNKETYEYNYLDLAQEYFIVNDRQTMLNHKDNHNIRLALDYMVSAEHAVGIQFNGWMRDTRKNIYNTNNICKEQGISIFESIQDGYLESKNFSGTVYYSYLPKSKKNSFTFLYDKSTFNTDDITSIEENELFKENDVKTTIEINAVKADWQMKLPDNWVFNAGGKYSYMLNLSTTKLTKQGEKIKHVDYRYRENTGAGYILLSKQINRFSCEGGLRMEISDNVAKSNGENIRKTAPDPDFLPSLSVDYKLSEKWNLSTIYAMKISRPTFQDMNPAINYIDSLTYFQGNPELIPETHQSINFKISYKSYASIGFNYIRKNNMLAWYIEQDETTPIVTRATQKNIKQSDTYSIDIVVPYQNKWLIYNVATGFIITNSNDETTNSTQYKKNMWYLYSGIGVNLPYDIKIGADVRYFTKGLENIFYFDPVFRMDLNFRKTFLNNKLNLTLLWNDVFSSDKMNTYTTLGKRHILYNYYFDQSVVQLSLTYHFKVPKLKYKSKSGIETEKNRIKAL